MGTKDEIIDSKVNEIIKIGKYLWERKIVFGNDGNISTKIDSCNILITGSGTNLGFLEKNDIVQVDINSTVRSNIDIKKPSSELNLHISCYKANSLINAVVHTHPSYATALSTISKGIIDPTLTNIVIQFGKIPVIPYATPASEEIGQVIASYVKNKYRAMILEHHGAIALGYSLFDAYCITEQIENLSKTVLIAKKFGIPRCIRKKDIKKLMLLRTRFGIDSPYPKVPNILMCSRNEFVRSIGYHINKLNGD